MASCWVTHGRTESGDSLKVLIFKNKPEDWQIDAAYRVIYPDEYDECDGVSWQLDESMFIEND